MNLRDFDNYREHLQKSGMEPGLERITTLCDKLGNPQNRMRFIHVAGTNGKGSVCAFLSCILKEAGFKVGRFTSPAVVDEKERYWINGRNVSQAALCRNMEEVKAAADVMALEGDDEPTLFEAETALAFMIFAEAGCEIVVLECGMGGANDATNVINTPLLSIFTSISLDHTKYLGKTIEAITREKSGIIKAGGHVVSMAQRPETAAVIKAKATLMKNDLTTVDLKSVRNVKYNFKGTTFDYGRYRGVKIHLTGSWQVENAATAIAAIETLKKARIRIAEEHVRAGLEAAEWPGRFEVISNKPLVIVDGAHNEDAARRLAQSVELYLRDRIEAGKLIFVFGVLADKNYPAIAEMMCPLASHVITVTPPDNPRALPSVQLAETVQKYNDVVSTASSLLEALEMAYLLSDRDGAILVFGSLSFLGEVRNIIESKGTYLSRKQMKI